MDNQERNMGNDEELNSEKKVKEKGIMGEVWEYVKMVIIVVGAVFIINNFIIINAKIPSQSMENTIMTGDQIFGFRLAYLFSDPKRNDIVIFKYPDDESELFIKRIIGLPGETVEIKDGKVYIDNAETPLEDSYIAEPMLGDYGPYEVPENHYFMLGDNRNMSKDSRLWNNKFVSKDKILGKAGLRYFPFDQIGIVK